MLRQEQCSWLADQIELRQFRRYGVVIPDVTEVVDDLRAGTYTEGTQHQCRDRFTIGDRMMCDVHPHGCPPITDQPDGSER